MHHRRACPLAPSLTRAYYVAARVSRRRASSTAQARRVDEGASTSRNSYPRVVVVTATQAESRRAAVVIRVKRRSVARKGCARRDEACAPMSRRVASAPPPAPPAQQQKQITSLPALWMRTHLAVELSVPIAHIYYSYSSSTRSWYVPADHSSLGSCGASLERVLYFDVHNEDAAVDGYGASEAGAEATKEGTLRVHCFVALPR